MVKAWIRGLTLWTEDFIIETISMNLKASATFQIAELLGMGTAISDCRDVPGK